MEYVDNVNAGCNEKHTIQVNMEEKETAAIVMISMLVSQKTLGRNDMDLQETLNAAIVKVIKNNQDDLTDGYIYATPKMDLLLKSIANQIIEAIGDATLAYYAN